MNLKKFMIDQGSKNVSRKLKDQRKLRNSEFDKVCKAASRIFKNSKKIEIDDGIYVDFSKKGRTDSKQILGAQWNYDVKDFISMPESNFMLDCGLDGSSLASFDFDFFEDVSDPYYFDGMDRGDLIEFLNPYWAGCEDLWKSIVKAVNALHLKTISPEPETDWDKWEGSGFLNLKASDDFEKECREFGYISFPEYCARKGYK